MKKCVTCGKEFKAERSTKKYCTTECKDKYNNSGDRKKARNKRYSGKDTVTERDYELELREYFSKMKETNGFGNLLGDIPSNIKECLENLGQTRFSEIEKEYFSPFKK